ncbi:AIP3 [Symbiodinium microadriaticum]|nr:AIP3 [Symbiodinium microadriaticum]
MSDVEQKDIEVAREDQQRINRFSRLNLRYDDLDEEIAKIKKDVQTYKDATEEIEGCMEDNGIMVKLGEVFTPVDEDSVLEKLANLVEKSEAALSQKSDEIETVRGELDSLKKEIGAQGGQDPVAHGYRGRKSEKPPEAKRHKRLDVLESLGIDQNARGHPATPSSSSAKTAVQSLSGSSSDKEELRKWLAGEDVAGHALDKDPAAGAEPDAAAPLPAAQNAAENAAEADAAAAAVDSATPSAATEPVKSPRPVINWREAFSKAQDRWDVVEGGARCYYHHSDKGLFFEWDQQTGVLFQYFFGAGEARSVPVGDDDLPERGPIWSSECPDTHAEVWEVLPLPPTDPRAKADLDMPSTQGGQTSESAEMPPPKKRKKTLPPVPVMAAAPAGPADGDDDDDDPRLPEEAEPTVPVLGCEGPPAAAPSSSSVSAEPEEEEEELEGQVGSFVLDEDEEAADLASEDCALPAAPADKAEPSAADLDLDMFADM